MVEVAITAGARVAVVSNCVLQLGACLDNNIDKGLIFVLHDCQCFVSKLVRNWDNHKCITMYIAGGVLLTATLHIG